MTRKERRGSWELVLEIIQEIEATSTDPVERWGMLKGIVQYRMKSPVLQYKIDYMKRRAEEKAQGKDDDDELDHIAIDLGVSREALIEEVLRNYVRHEEEKDDEHD